MGIILIVEDDELNRTMIAMRLRWEGYEVLTASDGAEGVAQARTHTPSLILLDLGLPILTGWQVMSRLQQDPATAAIPVIVLTAYMLDVEAKVKLPDGCADYEPKPVDFGRLLAKIAVLAGPPSPKPSA